MIRHRLRILLTNDDGIDAPGLAVLREIAAQISDDVWVVAPDSNQSGVGHRFTLGRELSLMEQEHQVYAVEGGSPADCVVAAVTYLLKDRRPDVVLSGVNNGQNLGDIIHCSGTAAGAREGALHNAVGIALSQAVDYPRGREVDWTNARRHGPEIIRRIIDAAAGNDSYYNVNFPFCPPDEVSGVRIVPHQRFSRSVFSHYPSQNEGRFFIAIPETPLPLDEASDFHVLHHEGAVTVTPMALAQTDVVAAKRLRGKLGDTVA